MMTEAAIRERKQGDCKQYKELLRISYQNLTDEDKKIDTLALGYCRRCT